MRRHRYFRSKLEALAQKHPGKICGPHGEGMMIAFTPGNGGADEAKDMLMRLYQLGLMGFLAGGNPTRIRFLPPPGVTTEKHIDLACEIIEKALV
jgi:acetylornithine aminotransferase